MTPATKTQNKIPRPKRIKNHLAKVRLNSPHSTEDSPQTAPAFSKTYFPTAVHSPKPCTCAALVYPELRRVRPNSATPIRPPRPSSTQAQFRLPSHGSQTK